MKRNRKQLENAIQRARSRRSKAIACYCLGVFHDNNNRESDAIPCYRQALRIGLNRPTKAKALTWLSSSLYKVGKRKVALQYARQAKRIAKDPLLSRFIEGLIRRILT